MQRIRDFALPVEQSKGEDMFTWSQCVFFLTFLEGDTPSDREVKSGPQL
jgi:hypothetical protein